LIDVLASTVIRTHPPQDYAKTKDRLGAFLTYADNAAVGYFKKQGFTATISLPKEQVRICGGLRRFEI